MISLGNTYVTRDASTKETGNVNDTIQITQNKTNHKHMNTTPNQLQPMLPSTSNSIDSFSKDMIESIECEIYLHFLFRLNIVESRYIMN